MTKGPWTPEHWLKLLIVHPATRAQAPIQAAWRWVVGGTAKYGREILLLLVTLAVTLTVLEAAYRLYHYYTLPGRLYALVDAQIPADLRGAPAHSTTDEKIPDVHAGYLYAPNYQGQRGHPWHSKWRTNSHGHVSRFEYPREKPAGEYRIAVIGDSFTANITNNVRWTEVLEETLNASESWRRQVGDKFTRVINFGVDAMGMVQFAAIARHHAVAFGPDLVIVNMISDSILRRLRYVSIPISHEDRDGRIRQYVKRNFLERIDWFGLCPELVVATIGRLWGKRCALPLDAKDILAAEPSFRFSNRAEALRASSAAVKDIQAVSRNVLFLVMPLYQELRQQHEPMWRGLVEDLRALVPDAKFVPMLPQMDALLEGKRLRDRPELRRLSDRQIMQLPEEKRPEIYRWFFLPEDVHYTDHATALYAREVAKRLIADGVAG